VFSIAVSQAIYSAIIIFEEVLSMPKLKSHSASKKRFIITGTGKVKRNKAYKTHILTKKTTKRKRNLRKPAVASDANAAIIKAMLPYK